MRPIGRVGKGGRGVRGVGAILLPPLPTRSVGAIAEQQQAKSDGVGKGARDLPPPYPPPHAGEGREGVVPGAVAHPTIR
jgi:hypothetical protein